MSKRLFGTGGIVSNELGRWNRDIDQATKKLDKQMDNAARNVDSSLAEMLGMQDGAKPSDLPNQDSTSAANVSPTVVVDQSKASETTPQPTLEVQTSDSSATNTVSSVEPVVSAAVETVTKEEASQDQVKETKTSASEITPQSQDDKVETSPIGATVLEVSDKTTGVGKTQTVAKVVEDKILVWAKTLLDHKKLTKVDEQGLPYFIKTEEEVKGLTNKIFELASGESDSSYITIASELVAEVNTFYSGSDLFQ